MSALWFERPGWRGQPGLHALIVGISAYANLPGTTHALQPEHFGMLQLASPALTAFRLAMLLKERADDFAIPLATCRVLLAPSKTELEVEPALADFEVVPDFVNFSVEAKAWRTDACEDEDGMTLFFFAGHGLQRVKHDHVLVLHNFNDGIGGSLSSKAINVDHLVDGMAASAGQEKIARTQLYFFDTCRIEADAFKTHEIMGVGAFWDVKNVPAVDDRVQPSFFSSKPGDASFGKAGAETLFGGALLKCLQGGAGRQVDEADPFDDNWIISLESLRTALMRFVNLANQQEQGAQKPITQNMDSDFYLLRLKGPPDVSVRLQIDPETAAPLAKVSILNIDNDPVRDLGPFEPALNTILPAGVLLLRATVEPEQPKLLSKLQRMFLLQPPDKSLTLPLSRP